MITGATVTLCNGVYTSPLTDWMTDRFYELIYVSQYDERSARILRIMQEEVEHAFDNYFYQYFSG